jgi:hypothetical protein
MDGDDRRVFCRLIDLADQALSRRRTVPPGSRVNMLWRSCRAKTSKTRSPTWPTKLPPMSARSPPAPARARRVASARDPRGRRAALATAGAAGGVARRALRPAARGRRSARARRGARGGGAGTVAPRGARARPLSRRLPRRALPRPVGAYMRGGFPAAELWPHLAAFSGGGGGGAGGAHRLRCAVGEGVTVAGRRYGRIAAVHAPYCWLTRVDCAGGGGAVANGVFSARAGSTCTGAPAEACQGPAASVGCNSAVLMGVGHLGGPARGLRLAALRVATPRPLPAVRAKRVRASA